MKIIIILGIVAALLAAFYLVPLSTEKGPRTYASETYGISFSYSAKYLVVETDPVSGERIQHFIMLIEDTPENRALLAGEAPGREGPPVITIGIYQNNLDNYTAESFIKDTSFSNFKLSDGTQTPQTVGGLEGLAYHATGLYENDNIVVARPDLVYMLTVNYLTPTDTIISDFESVLATVQFTE